MSLASARLVADAFGEHHDLASHAHAIGTTPWSPKDVVVRKQFSSLERRRLECCRRPLLFKDRNLYRDSNDHRYRWQHCDRHLLNQSWAVRRLALVAHKRKRFHGSVAACSSRGASLP